EVVPFGEIETDPSPARSPDTPPGPAPGHPGSGSRNWPRFFLPRSAPGSRGPPGGSPGTPAPPIRVAPLDGRRCEDSRQRADRRFSPSPPTGGSSPHLHQKADSGKNSSSTCCPSIFLIRYPSTASPHSASFTNRVGKRLYMEVKVAGSRGKSCTLTMIGELFPVPRSNATSSTSSRAWLIHFPSRMRGGNERGLWLKA